ncbi:MAG TPA: ribosome maturation factor [Balneola sp.]|jgi:ribosome maturation factor RimP|nr:ribosome maturation factor [Balneola sp.]MAO77668.1 ribosome maturation factor [Balneola sp.]MBF63994.1 ribosome maturation factor [Balneola sp.]HAH51831.1 ribosome maturation factor [Balneola sp.]HAW80386.1 ribosome maturation factor [Balneola sp.]|tara:strand:- start:9602 stop:10063 length:462 start_codon:yes stop_codon:yes gene_type:complete
MQLDTIQKIKDLAAPLVEPKDLFVVDVELKTGSGLNEVWLYLDAQDRGVNLDECADISRELGFLMEAHELFENKYRLNVSSPGLSRPLSDVRQYKKNEGRKAKVKFKKEDEYDKTEGIIVGVDENGIMLEDQNGKSVKVLFDDIKEAKIVPNI